jgi:23S rRNA (adenine-N6)-dimethyltransferase
LRILLSPSSKLVAADLVLQRAAIRRYLEGRAPGAQRWERHWTFAAGRSLPRRAFQPPPQVDSAILMIRRRYAK